jgi:N-acetyl-1-D-myo-inositol-2-amino-2-deoxy-alpha-D-glucopyranoside deacetylase
VVLALTAAASWGGPGPSPASPGAALPVASAASGSPLLYHPTRGDSMVVFAAHPDDEALGAAGVVHAAVLAGVRVRLVIFTNGDGYLEGVDVGFRTLFSTPNRFIQYGKQRQQEALAAAGRLGLAPAQVTFLGYPDRGLAVLWGSAWSCDHPYTSPYTRHGRSPYPLTYHPGALYCGQNVLEDVENLLRHERPTIIVSHHPEDSHRDHWAAAAFVVTALEHLALEDVPWAKTVRVWSYMVHYGVWPQPQAYAPQLNLNPPPGLQAIGPGWIQYPLGQPDEDAKRMAILEYRSQVQLLRGYMLSFVRRNELFGPPPRVSPTRLWGQGLPLAAPELWDRLSPAIRVPSGGSLLHAAEGSAKLDSIALAQDTTHLYVAVRLRNPAIREARYRLDFRLFYRDGRLARLSLIFGVPQSLAVRPRPSHDLPLPPGAAARSFGSRIHVVLPLYPLGDPASVLMQVATVGPLKMPVDRSAWTLVRLEPARVGARSETGYGWTLAK